MEKEKRRTQKQKIIEIFENSNKLISFKFLYQKLNISRPYLYKVLNRLEKEKFLIKEKRKSRIKYYIKV